MRKLTLITATLAVLCAGTTASMTKPTRTKNVTLQLQQVKEIRRQVLAKNESGSDFTMFDTPGLELRFGLRVPQGRKIVEIRQPSVLDAVDSSGTDLSKLPPTGFGTPKHVDVIREWEKPPHALTFKLGLPARAAERFTLATRMDAVTYLDTTTRTLKPETKWTKMKGDLFGDQKVKARLESKRGSVHLVFKPGTVREMIEKVELKGDGPTLESEGVMWNNQHASYMFTGKLTPGMTAEVTVRQGLETMPVEIALQDQPLP